MLIGAICCRRFFGRSRRTRVSTDSVVDVRFQLAATRILRPAEGRLEV